MKRLLDVIVAGGVLLLASPLLAVVSLAIKLGSPGPVLYPAPRVGRGGGTFRMLKFRTMVVNADRIGGSSSPDDDPRITRIGRILRRTKLDELPQFFNVLGGSMSLVGPRPQIAHDVAKYTDEERAILTVQPGITDWASIRFHNEGEILAGHADPDQAYIDLIRPEKLRLCLEYVRRRSLATDLAIIWMTVRRLLGLPVVLP